MNVRDFTWMKLRDVHRNLYVCEGCVKRGECREAVNRISSAIAELEEVRAKIAAFQAKEPKGVAK